MDIEEAKNWLASIDVHSETEASCKELILSEIEENETEYHDLAGEIHRLETELEKKDKIIDLMAEQLAGLAIFDMDIENPIILGDKEEVKKYFEEKVEK